MRTFQSYAPTTNISLLAEAQSIVAKAVAKGWARRPGVVLPIGKIVKFEPAPKGERFRL